MCNTGRGAKAFLAHIAATKAAMDGKQGEGRVGERSMSDKGNVRLPDRHSHCSSKEARNEVTQGAKRTLDGRSDWKAGARKEHRPATRNDERPRRCSRSRDRDIKNPRDANR